ncbi:MAG: MFS transporter [Anaerolineae bacterium]|nr:MFS transporter [Anaerolineae bacterium]
MTARPAAQRAPWLVLAIVSLPVFIGALDLTIISAVLPEVIVSLDLPVKEYLDHASWAVSGYLLAYAISMTFAGRLSDLFGRRAVYITCLLIFMAGSYLVTTYDSPALNSAVARFYRQVLNEPPPRLEERYLDLVIFGRVVQAFGAGAMVPVTIALAGDLFPPERRARPLGVVGAVDTLGWVLGHLYGGVMVRLFGQHGDAVVDAFAGLGVSVARPSWETLFLLNIPVSALALVGAWWALRGIHRPRRVGRFDLLGTLFLTLALIGLSLGLGANPEAAGTAGSFEDLERTASHYGPPLLIGAALAFLLFLLVEARVSHPLIRLGMFRSRNVSASSVANFLVGFCLAIGLVSAPLLVNFRMDSPTSEDVQHAAYTAGLLLSGLTVPMALAAVPGGWLSERAGYRLPTMLGLLIAGIGFALTGATWESDTSYWVDGRADGHHRRWPGPDDFSGRHRCAQRRARGRAGNRCRDDPGSAPGGHDCLHLVADHLRARPLRCARRRAHGGRCGQPGGDSARLADGQPRSGSGCHLRASVHRRCCRPDRPRRRAVDARGPRRARARSAGLSAVACFHAASVIFGVGWRS